ncbi:unnamed protein product, partial [Mesorhabditis belari]|uniref:small monomeric GTPase n=1 Tax=Mesorhabditis belari TaxID=2138241 RepID=A0AAF3JA31_9BILA
MTYQFKFDSRTRKLRRMSESTKERITDSDYGTSICTTSSDDESLRSESDRSITYLPVNGGDYFMRDLDASRTTLSPGHCPHCQMLFRKPLVLSCGHSLCSSCCSRLLNVLNGNGGKVSKKTRIRMGVTSLYTKYHRIGFSSSLASTSSSSLSSIASSSIIPIYKTPECPQCGETPKMTAPIPNLELERLLSKGLPNRISEYDNPIYRESDQENFVETIFDSAPIQECSLAVLGAPGVGKTSITRVQYGNEMMICGENAESSGIFIDILDDHRLEENLSKAHGFVLVYAITDRDSLTTAEMLSGMIREHRGDQVPIVLVGSKSDADRRRVVTAYEGQRLARQIGAPFREVSARKNDGINEAFDELLSLIAVGFRFRENREYRRISPTNLEKSSRFLIQ